jgi:hypothetical protein|tara:strand:+ start:9986 stop:10174 length:189 start_codon:yes stop_codon:yes gene_type:complete
MISKIKMTKICAAVFFASLIGLAILEGELKYYCLYLLTISGSIANIAFLMRPKKRYLKNNSK